MLVVRHSCCIWYVVMQVREHRVFGKHSDSSSPYAAEKHTGENCFGIIHGRAYVLQCSLALPIGLGKHVLYSKLFAQGSKQPRLKLRMGRSVGPCKKFAYSHLHAQEQGCVAITPLRPQGVCFPGNCISLNNLRRRHIVWIARVCWLYWCSA